MINRIKPNRSYPSQNETNDKNRTKKYQNFLRKQLLHYFYNIIIKTFCNPLRGSLGKPTHITPNRQEASLQEYS